MNEWKFDKVDSNASRHWFGSSGLINCFGNSLATFGCVVLQIWLLFSQLFLSFSSLPVVKQKKRVEGEPLVLASSVWALLLLPSLPHPPISSVSSSYCRRDLPIPKSIRYNRCIANSPCFSFRCFGDVIRVAVLRREKGQPEKVEPEQKKKRKTSNLVWNGQKRA